MEKLSIWCKYIASVSVSSAVLMLLVPDGKMKKAFNSLLAFILLFSVLSPIINMKSVLYDVDEFKFSENGNLSQEIEKYKFSAAVSVAESEIERYINEMLSDSGFECKFKVTCDIENDEIFIKEIEVTGKFSEQNKTVIEEKICNTFGSEVGIVFTGD